MVHRGKAVRRTRVYQTRRHGWTRKWFLSAVKSLRPTSEAGDDAELGVELLAQLIEVASQTPAKDCHAIWEAINSERYDRLPGTSPQMYTIARVLLDRGSVARLQRLDSDPVEVLSTLLSELHPQDRTDKSLADLPVHAAAIEALGKLATRSALHFLVSWLQYSDAVELHDSPVFTALTSAGDAAHAAILADWEAIPWRWRSALLETVFAPAGIRHEALRLPLVDEFSRIGWDDLSHVAFAAAAYRDPSSAPYIANLLNFSLDVFEQRELCHASEFNPIAEIAETLEALLGVSLSESQRERCATQKSRLQAHESARCDGARLLR